MDHQTITGTMKSLGGGESMLCCDKRPYKVTNKCESISKIFWVRHLCQWVSPMVNMLFGKRVSFSIDNKHKQSPFFTIFQTYRMLRVGM